MNYSTCPIRRQYCFVLLFRSSARTLLNATMPHSCGSLTDMYKCVPEGHATVCGVFVAGDGVKCCCGCCCCCCRCRWCYDIVVVVLVVAGGVSGAIVVCVVIFLLLLLLLFLLLLALLVLTFLSALLWFTYMLAAQHR